ncbi:uncharacterized protein LOC126833485 [Adelges cooleyi]|uniref:uncharacterized protein LOC126833485 n=1 Tax=Adelges cooleyi TaxID=133065 RepID=UPI00218088DE|nr:uncharacterized protein LOC126833485 [Adelges cooleyi]
MDTNIGVFENAIIQVVVESVVPDMIVVSYTAKNGSVYQGILLNNAKRRFPCGSVPLTKPALSPRNCKTESDNDVLYAVTQRFTYFQNTPTTFKKIPNKTKKVKKPMTVRLRPRQVLCTKCKSICTENSDNVENSKDPVKNGTNQLVPEVNGDRRLLRSQGPVPEPTPKSKSNCISDMKSMCRTLMPNIAKLKPREITDAFNKYPTLTEIVEWDDNKKDCEDDCDSEDNDEESAFQKKPIVGSVEDLWDDTTVEETKKTPIIKITFGSQGEGTVMEIPSRQADGESEPNKLLRKRGKRRRQDGEKRKKHKKRHKEHENNPDINNISFDTNNLNAKEEYNIATEPNDDYETNGEHYDETKSNSSHNLLIIPKLEPDETNSCFVLKSGKVLHEGDIVWGKVKGFPWWPAKVSNFATNNGEEHGSFVNVTWFGSSTSSLLNCDQINPFLDFYKSRFNKHKKTTSYKEAIKQAMAEAKLLQNTPTKNES